MMDDFVIAVGVIALALLISAGFEVDKRRIAFDEAVVACSKVSPGAEQNQCIEAAIKNKGGRL